jgi:oligopeptide/dipeptide ABC transporter ATP-binding protein
MWSSRGREVTQHQITAAAEPLLRAVDVVKHFPAGSRRLRGGRPSTVSAVDSVSLEVHRGETLGLVGESGCGKSTLVRCLMRLYELSGGEVSLDGHDISRLSQRELRPYRRDMQMVFQDPYGSLNPRRRVGSLIGDALSIHGSSTREQRSVEVHELMRLVGLNPEHFNRYPAEFSGGQRQRIGLARALALRPRLVICDEPVSALDVSIQAQIINLLAELQHTLGLTYVFVAHDLSVVRFVSDRVAVMYLGHVVEVAPTEELFDRPRHPYTFALLSAVLPPDPEAATRSEQLVLSGEVPSPIDPPAGCRFHPRCPRAQEVCRVERPPLVAEPATKHSVACHFPLDVPAAVAPSREPTQGGGGGGLAGT